MTREIKFRAYLKQEKEMREVFSFCDKFIKVIVGMGTAWKLPINEFEPIMQFTGLKDKNGKDIYEGDIIKTINNNFGVIVKKDHCFEVTVSENQSSLYRADWIEQSEILGNIFDNPNLISELLKSQGEKII